MRALVIALLLLSGGLASAGPWVPGRWHFYLQLREGALWTPGDVRYDAHGARQPIRLVDNASLVASGYRQSLTDLYAEVGLARRLSVLLDFILLDYVAQPLPGRPARSSTGVSDLQLGGKLLLFDDELTAALLVALTAPTGSSTTAVPLGPGDLRTDFRLLLGKLFDRPSLYLSAEIGLCLRGSAVVTDPQAPGLTLRVQYSHALRFAAAVGGRLRLPRAPSHALNLAAKLEGAYAFDGAVEDGLGLLTPQAGTYVKLGPEVGWSFPRGVQLFLGGHYFVAGRTMPAFAELALSLGFSR
jgi:hypothetical protein